MRSQIETLLKKYDLLRLKSAVETYTLPCVAFDLVKSNKSVANTNSKLGGNPYLPAHFIWPTDKDRPLDFLLQIDLAAASKFDSLRLLPQNGFLSFFYDLENQPWGYDPSDLQGFRTYFSTADTPMFEKVVTDSEFKLPECAIRYRSALSVPCIGSSSYNDFERVSTLTDQEADRYAEFSLELCSIGSSYNRKYWGGKHRLLGHSENVQGDMQLEAQLVTNGLYCGDPSGYNDKRAEQLKVGANDWLLLLQLDSDEMVDLMWGDVGSLYFWIRKQDLADHRFENVWMTLQCG